MNRFVTTLQSDGPQLSTIAELQRECPDCRPYINYKENETLPDDPAQAHKIDATSNNFILVNDVLYQVLMKKGNKVDHGCLKIVLPQMLRHEVL